MEITMRRESLVINKSNFRNLSLLSRMYRRVACLLLVLICAAGLNCEAQDYSLQTGSPTFSVNQPVPYGFVNLANGNVHVEIPLASAPQRGRLAFAAKLVYDSRIWQIVHAGGSLVWKPTNLPFSISGWRFVTNATPGTVTFDATQITRGCNDTDNPTVVNFVNFVWTSPDGTPRKFPVATAQDPGCADDVSAADGFAVDSSGYHMYVTSYSTVVVYAKDGTQVYPRVEDANGNYFTTDANGNVIDTLGRTVVQQSTIGNQTFYDVLNSQGTTSRITVTTKQIPVRTLFLQSGVSEDQETITVLDKVSLPNGEAYTFGYDAEVIVDPSTGAFQPGYGLLTGVSPGGGYTYKNFVDPFGIVNRWAASTIDSSIDYLANPGAIQATLSRNGGTEAFVFTLNNGAWLTTATTRIGSHQVQQISNTYDFTQTCPNPFINVILNPCIGPAYIRLLKAVTSTDVGSKQTTYGYDDPRFGNVTLIQDWNNFPPFATPAIPDRQTVITMHPVIGQNILDRVQTVVLEDGAGNRLSQSNYTYDGAALTTPTHVIVNNDTSVGTSRGNLTQVSRWAGGTAFLSTNFTYDTAGQVLSVKDAAGNLTKLDYTDNYFNDAGASQTFGAPNANPSTATNAYPTTITLPIGKVTLGYYYGSGKQAFAIDQNGQQTAQHFTDPLDRLSHTIGPKGWVQIAYDSLFSYDIFTGLNDSQPSTNCTSCVHLTNFVDLQGRVTSSTLASDPDGATTSTALYDIMGNTLTASNPTRSGTGASTKNSYDVLYRLTKSQNTDNSVAQVFYGTDVTAAGGLSTQLCSSAIYGIGFPILGFNEVGLVSQVWVDGFGRTIETDEPDAANVLSVATCNQYNVAGELTQVAQGSLTRTYKYDPLWRVTQVTTPEAGTETFSYVNDDGTLCSGDPSNACKRVDARGITTKYQYDALNRLTNTTYSDGTPSAVFNYDEPSALGVTLTNTAGRPSSIYTKDGTGNILTGEIFSYDPSGSIVNNSQCTPQNCGTGVFQNTYTADQMGNTVAFSNSWGRSVGAKLNNAGQVTAITVGGSDATHPGTLLSNAKYNAMGEMTSSTLGNGLQQAFGYSDTMGWLNSARVGTNSQFTNDSPGTPGSAVVSVSGSIKQATTTAVPGRATLTISGQERSVANGTVPALPSTGTLSISRNTRPTQLAAAGAGDITIGGAIQTKQAVVQPATVATGTVSISGTQQSKVVVVQAASSGSDTLTINGTLQSKQVTQPATASSGVFTVNGALQTKAAVLASSSSGSVTFSGNEQSKAGTPATPGRISVTVNGFEASFTTDPCADQGAEPPSGRGGTPLSCPHTIYDGGTVTVTVNGHPDSAPYSSGSSTTSIATGLANAVNVDSASPVTASSSGAVLTLTSKASGSGSNYSFTSTSSTNDVADFGGPSFSVAPTNASLTAGANAGPQTFDSGTCSVTINGTPYSSSFGQGDNTNTIASRLATSISAGTFANGTVSGATLSLTSKQTGSASNYSLASACSFDSSNFTIASFSTSTSGATLTGGVNAAPAVTDAGTLTLKVGSTFTASACYGPSGNCAAVSGCSTGDSTSAQVACALASPGNTNGLNRAGSPVRATVTAGSSTISMQASAVGASTNYSLSNSSTFNTSNFSSASFSASASGPNMAGGKDAITNTIYDSGTTSVILGGHSTQYAWTGSATTAAGIASGLAGAINGDTGAVVNASVTSPGNIKLTARAAGASTNYTAQTSTTFDSANFSASSFSTSLLTATLTGGADAVNNTIYDSGTATVTVNAHPDYVPWSGQGATAAGIASALVATINGDSAALVTASVPAGGTVISLKTKQGGISSNYSISSSSTFDSAHFSSSAFAASSVGTMLTGGTDAVTKPIYDSGTVSLAVSNFTASAAYGPLNGTNPWEFQRIMFGGQIASFLGDTSSPYHIFYITSNHVHEVSSDSNGNWRDDDITAASGSATSAYFNLASFAGNATSPKHVFYLNVESGFVRYHVHELSSDAGGNWHDRDITAASGGPNAFGTSGLVAFSGNSAFPEHVFYLDTNGHVHEQYSDSAGNWHDQDESVATGAPAATFNNQNGFSSDLSGFFQPGSNAPEHVFYFDANPNTPQIGDVHELYSDSSGAWHNQDITVAAGGVPGFGFVTSCPSPNPSSPEHVFYLGYTNGVLGLNHMWVDSSGWHHENTHGSGQGGLSCLVDTNTGFLHVFAVAGDVYDNWKDSSGVWHTQDLTALSGAPSWLNGSIISLFDGVTAHIFYGAVHLYSTDTSAPLMAAALVNDIHTGLNIAASPVRATVSGSTIHVTSKTTGAATDYNVALSSTYDSADFPTPSFPDVNSTLTGGQDAINTPLYSGGTLSVAINGHTNSVAFGLDARPEGVAADLADAINLDGGAQIVISGSLSNRGVVAADAFTPFFMKSAGVMDFLDSNGHARELVPLSNGWAMTDLTGLAGAASARAASGLAGYVDSSNLTRLFYINSSNDIEQLLWDGTSWTGTDVTAAIGGPQVTSSSNAPLLFRPPNIIDYLDSTSDIRELIPLNGSWSTPDVTAQAGAPKAGSLSLAGYVDSSNFTHLIYVNSNNHIEQLLWNGTGWTGTDITTAIGGPNTRSLGLTPLLFRSPNIIDYFDANGDVRELIPLSGSWSTPDATAQAGAPSTVPIANVPPLTAYVDSSNFTHLFYVNSSHHIEQLLWNGTGWTGTDISAAIGGPNTVDGTPLFMRSPGIIDYIDASGDVRELIPANGSWSTPDVSAQAGAPKSETNSGVPLTGYTDNSGNTHLLYLDANRHVQQLLWNGVQWTGTDLSVAAATTPDSGTASLTVGGFTATVCYGSSVASTCVGQPVNSTAAQVAAALANALNVASSPVTATVSGSTLSLNWKALQPVAQSVSALINTHDFPSQASNASFTSLPTTSGGASVTASASGNVVTFTSKAAGANTAYAYLPQITTDSLDAQPGFTFQPTAATILRGGQDAGTGTAWDTGIITVTANGFSKTIPYGQSDSPASLSAAIATAFNTDPNSAVWVCQPCTPLTFTARKGGSSTNYSVSARSTTNNPNFLGSSFSASFAGPTLTGGLDSGSTTTISDSGYVSFSAGSFTATVEYGQNTPAGAAVVCCTASDIASALSAAINQSSSSPVTATVSGSQLQLIAKTGGVKTNYPYSLSSHSNDPADFPAGSFSPTSGTLSGGADGFIYALDLGTDSSGTIFGANDNVNGDWSYEYDNLNRLESAFTPDFGYTYDYDIYGNRLRQTPLNGGNALSLLYVNNRISATGVTYDASGNMTSDGNHTYAYDAENRLVSVDNGQTATYTYNANGQRIRSTANGTSVDFVYDLSGQAVGVLRPDGTLIRQEIDGLATYSDAAYFHHRDWLGNLRVVTDQTGSIRQTCTNLPYGDGLTCTAAGVTPTHFTGYTRDTETNLDFANARYYTSQFGRFMSVDPLGGSVFDPQSLNAYAYVGNGPLSATDSSGMSIDDPVGNIWLIYSGATAANGGPSIWGFSAGPFNFHLSAANSILQPGTGVGGSFALCGLIAGCGGSFDKGPPPPSNSQLSAERSSGSIAMGGLKEASNTLVSIMPGCGFVLMQIPGTCPHFEASNAGEKIGMNTVFAATLFIPGGGEEEAAAKVEQRIGNAATHYLYQKLGPLGEHLKYGITKNLGSRYTAAELGGGRLRILARGARQEMLRLERELHSTLPIGPEENQAFYVIKQILKGLRPPPY
jgi:RHS repeat-associated protein